MTQTERVLQQFAAQAKACDQLGSPFTAALCRLLAARLDTTTQFGRRILEWPGDPFADNVALRAAGALHALSRSGWDPILSSVYPPNQVTEATLWTAIRDVLAHHDHFLTERLSGAPQTNEVARSAVLLGAMLTIAAETRHPLEIFEIGASAGLNLGFDQYRYELGEGRHWGNPDSPLTLECAWHGITPPLAAPLVVIGRHGCDLNPVDPVIPADRERLMAYVWADQTHRLQRMAAALDLAAAGHRSVDKADAADWLEEKLSVPPSPGVTRVLFHTIVWQYLPESSKNRIGALIERLRHGATPETPLARVAMEADDTPDRGARLELTLWPGGHTRMLGRGDFHGRWAEWL